MKISAGLLVYSWHNNNLEFLVVHPSGEYNRYAPYYLPKGKVEEGESFEQAALRETLEETGIKANIICPLSDVVYKTKTKIIKLFLAEYVSGSVDSYGNCTEHDDENDVVKFASRQESINILREEFKPIIDEGYTIIDKLVKENKPWMKR